VKNSRIVVFAGENGGTCQVDFDGLEPARFTEKHPLYP
jgi:hypothetical protein